MRGLAEIVKVQNGVRVRKSAVSEVSFSSRVPMTLGMDVDGMTTKNSERRKRKWRRVLGRRLPALCASIWWWCAVCACKTHEDQ